MLFDTLPGLEARDSLFLVQPAMLADASLTRSPQAFSVSGCPSATTLRPSALTFLAAFQSLKWCVRHPGQVHSRLESERSSFLYPHRNRVWSMERTCLPEQSDRCSTGL